MYNLPIYLRIFYYRRLADKKDDENERQQKANQKINKSFNRPKTSPRKFSGKSFK